MFENILIGLEKVFNSSPFLGLGASFLAGILVSFSPCIYPLIPITLGIAGIENATTKLRGFTISLTFVLGVAFIYTCLRIATSILGMLLCNFFINPVTYLALVLIFSFLGVVLLFEIKINIPFFTFNYECSRKKELFSIFILGAVSGLALIPCNFPVLGAILSIIALKKNILYGGIALFIFSLGYGTILIILGTFTSLIRRLPKQGLWLIIVRKVIGLIFLAMAGYFLFKFINLL